MTRPTPPCTLVVTVSLVATLAVAGALRGQAQAPPQTQADTRRAFQPALTAPEELEPYLTHLEPGRDTFPLEKDAQAIEARLSLLGTWLTSGADTRTPPDLLAPSVRGTHLRDTTRRDAGRPGPAAPSPDAAWQITRADADAGEPTLDRGALAAELAALVADVPQVRVTEFLVTAIDPLPQDGRRTDVRYDIVGHTPEGGGVQHVGTWRIDWQTEAEGWRAVRWVRVTHTTSRTPRPVFTEVTEEAFARAPSHAAQLTLGLDAWMATLDGVLTRDSNGHHGVSVGDANGDGLDDLYVAQPSGLPNRLFLARGDGTFEDGTEQAGVGLLDDTAQSLFVDVDNDGDQDLVLATSLQPLLLRNDGTGRFTLEPDAFAFVQAPQGVLTGVAMADFDRDGYLDVYLCVYSYFFGAGEDKAGTPMPYHDARNGPPGILLRNDGGRRFVDVTREVGLDEGNDRYHFAASWADYDGDGWPDLLVANDFGTKNLYRNLGARGGPVRFEDVAAQAGVLDHGAGMSAAWVDYDNDGLLDIYVGNMWSASGQRVTSAPTFMPDAPEDVRALYRRHARGNALFRNRGDGTFDDRTLPAGVAMGRWAWASDAIDVDSDGCQDLYVVNGMLTRSDTDGGADLDGFYWRQVEARSPLTRNKGAPYDDAWRAINLRLVRGSIASGQRNVLLRNNCGGAFDEVGGAAGLDLDQDGRSFAVMDVDRDGDPDLVVMAARQVPQLRVFRNDHPARATVAIRLEGTGTSPRDAIGARVDIETDTLRGTRLVQAGSGFLSQHSRELLFGLGESRRVRTLTVQWPSGTRQVFTDLPVDTRFRLVEGGSLEQTPIVRAAPQAVSPTASPAVPGTRTAPEATWMFEPFPAPDIATLDLAGTSRAVSTLAGRPAVLLFWSEADATSRAALDRLAAGAGTLSQAGIGVVAIALDEADATARVRAAAPAGIPVVHASRDVAYAWAIAHRHLFMNRQPLALPTLMLLDGRGQIVRVYRGGAHPEALVRDAGGIEATLAERLGRALPFAGAFHAPLARRNFLPYGRELLDEGLDAAAIEAFVRAAAAAPAAPTLYRLGSLLSNTRVTARARAAYEQALALDPSLAEAHNDLGALLAQEGDLGAAITRFRQAIEASPDYPDALNNLGYALLLSGEPLEARRLYEQALALQPDFPEALNNLGLLLGRGGDLAAAERYFRLALTHRAGYGDAANNLALVLVASGRGDEAVAQLEALVAVAPEVEPAYLTLARIHLSAGRVPEGLRALERLLQRNPTHPTALALVREYRPR